ncbi:hypothetical protein RDV84_05530 [Lysobacter yananisis]|uniref:DUF4168 domain-containing protein n=1 Tax=Lysobacter yananisis TaxID=1003114 RepID=A0ABY9PB52_9GAMM|nr:hypothetical protein [Lysobacter yananisis]WMT04298.1 hypothetical protein RDV84_05530 [Lysobacter yananisis]
MKRPSRPFAPRGLAAPALRLLALAVLAAAAPVAGAQVDQRYDPANVNSRVNNPVFQRQMRQSAQSVAESLVGRSANATDQRILGQFDQVQTQALNQMQNALDRMPQPDPRYGQPGEQELDERTIQQMQQTPEGRYVLEQVMAERRRGGGVQRYPQAQAQYPQQQYQRAPQAQNDYDRLYQQAYPDGMQGPGQSRGGYPQPQSSTGRSLGGALLQDITNAAIQRSIGPRVQVQGNPYYYQQQQGRRP